MDPKSEKPLRLFVNPLTIWTELVFKTGEAMWATAHVAAMRANSPKVAVIPAADMPSPKAKAPVTEPLRLAAKPVQQASKAARFKAARAKARSRSRAKLRAKR
jgi:hypothetical protein